MTKKGKGTIVGIVIFFSFVAYSKGLDGLWDTLKLLANGFKNFGEVLFALITHFPDELGITDWLWTKGIYAAITLVAAMGLKYSFSAKEKKTLWITISTIVGLISGVLTFV